jgi:hypothetical protein
MKNAALYTAGILFWVIAVAQFLRYKLGIAVMVGTQLQIPTELSLYAAILMVVLGFWMFVAALTKNHKD